jgi:creatinine amidohydrolase/Fe(II)-dependent formamide hydrolase-like protein
MKIFAMASLGLVLCVPTVARAQAPSKSVWIQDYTAPEVVAKVSGGMTTLLYVGGATHADGPAVAVGKHVRVATVIAQRIAEEIGNALVLPINPYAEQIQQMAHTAPQSGSVVGGTIHLMPETHALLMKDVVNSAILAVRGSEGLVGTGFKNVMIMGDHTQGQDTIRRVASDLDREWKPKGVRVFYIDEGNAGKLQMEEYLGKLNRNITRARMTGIDDAAELMAVDPDHRWLRVDKLPADERDIITPQAGKAFLDFKVNAAVQQIRKALAEGATP